MKRLGLSALFFALLACDGNVYESVSDKKSDRYLLTEARQEINHGQYESAQALLDKVNNKESQEYVLLDVSVTLGSAHFGLWDLLLNIVESLTDSLSTGGVDQIFNKLSDSVFGVGDERTSRLAALTDSAEKLNNMEDKDDKTEAIRCFLTGLYVLPTVNDGITSLATATASLNDLASTVVGDGSTRAQCPGLDAFETAIALVNRVQTGLAFVIEATESCPMLNFADETATLNDVQERLNKFTTAADKGCEASLCNSVDSKLKEACRALNFGCVGELLEDATAVAGDGKVNQCELVTNCITGACFSS